MYPVDYKDISSMDLIEPNSTTVYINTTVWVGYVICLGVNLLL